MRTDKDIAVIGSNMVDLISYIERMPAEGETVEAPNFAMGCGGKGANQAVAAARLGSSVRMVTRVGNDIFADNTIANFERNGIDTTYVLPTEATSGVAPIFVDEESHNSIIIVKGANALLTPDDAPPRRTSPPAASSSSSWRSRWRPSTRRWPWASATASPCSSTPRPPSPTSCWPR